MKKWIKKLLIYFLLGAFGVLLLFELVYQAYNYTFSLVKTEKAMSTTITESIEASGYVIRDEQLIYTGQSGVYAYNVEDGGRVSAGSVVAYVYPSQEQAEKHQQIKRISAEISRLKELESDSNALNASNPELLLKEIDDKNMRLIKATADCDYIKASELREQILYLMTKYNIITGQDEGVSDRIAELSAQLSALNSSSDITPSTVGAPGTGYFISSTDGYEEVLTGQSVLQMTPDSFETAVSSVTQTVTPPGVVGKIAKGFKWYYACILDEDDADLVEDRVDAGRGISLHLSSCSNEDLEVGVAAVNRQSDGRALVIFECKNMSETLANARAEEASIVIGKYMGIGIDKKAIRALDMPITAADGFTDAIETDEEGTKKFVRRNAKGEISTPDYIDPYKVVSTQNQKGETVFVEKDVMAVFVLLADQVYAKRIDVIYDSGESSGTVICALKTGTAQDMARYVRLYDDVVVEGRNLYDGKIVN